MAEMDAFEMFRTGCNFSDCADLCLKGQDRAPESNLAYTCNRECRFFLRSLFKTVASA